MPCSLRVSSWSVPCPEPRSPRGYIPSVTQQGGGGYRIGRSGGSIGSANARGDRFHGPRPEASVALPSGSSGSRRRRCRPNRGGTRRPAARSSLAGSAGRALRGTGRGATGSRRRVGGAEPASRPDPPGPPTPSAPGGRPAAVRKAAVVRAPEPRAGGGSSRRRPSRRVRRARSLREPPRGTPPPRDGPPVPTPGRPGGVSSDRDRGRASGGLCPPTRAADRADRGRVRRALRTVRAPPPRERVFRIHSRDSTNPLAGESPNPRSPRGSPALPRRGLYRMRASCPPRPNAAPA